MADQNENSNPSPETMNDEEHPTEEESKDPPKEPVSNEPPTEEESKDPPEEPAPNETEETPVVTEIEVLNEQFENYMRIAKSLMKTLKRPKDIEICAELLRKVQCLNESRHLEVKRNNNRFFRYCLRVLKWTSENQPLHLYRQWVRTSLTSC